jgi:hypothetical protein
MMTKPRKNGRRTATLDNQQWIQKLKLIPSLLDRLMRPIYIQVLAPIAGHCDGLCHSALQILCQKHAV